MIFPALIAAANYRKLRMKRCFCTPYTYCEDFWQKESGLFEVASGVEQKFYKERNWFSNMQCVSIPSPTPTLNVSGLPVINVLFRQNDSHLHVSRNTFCSVTKQNSHPEKCATDDNLTTLPPPKKTKQNQNPNCQFPPSQLTGQEMRTCTLCSCSCGRNSA